MKTPATTNAANEIRNAFSKASSLGELLSIIYTGGSGYRSAVDRIVLALGLDDDQRVEMEQEYEDMAVES